MDLHEMYKIKMFVKEILKYTLNAVHFDSPLANIGNWSHTKDESVPSWKRDKNLWEISFKLWESHMYENLWGEATCEKTFLYLKNVP